MLVGSVPSWITFSTTEPSRVPPFLGSAELSVDYDFVPVDLPSISLADCVVCTPLVSELDEGVAVWLSCLLISNNADVLNLAEDLELAEKPVLRSVEVKSADKDGAVRIAWNLLIQVRMP